VSVTDGIVLAGWIVFWMYWLAASVGVKAAARPRRAEFVGFRVAVVLGVLLLLRAGAFKAHANPLANSVLRGIGLALFVAGLALAVWARVYLGRNWGTPMSQKIEPELVTTGPYRRVRHPIYSGIILGVIGTAIAVGLYWLVTVVLLGAYFIYSAIVEERNMAALFPDTYPGYKRSTTMLIPFVL
jgi:protein-S-isoprenylcysteine O-methyltransferase Ste14